MATEKATKPQEAAEQAINTALNQAEEISAKSVEAVETALSTSEKAIKDGMKEAGSYVEDQSSAFTSGYAQAATSASDNLDAAFKAAKETTQGWNAYTQQIMDYTKKAFAENMVVAEKFAAAKTPEEFAKLNSEVANKAVSRISGQSTKLSDIVQKTAAKAGQPIKEQAEKNIAAFTA
jgi:phasin family protein